LPCSFGDYELVEEIGRGGMGVIYKARQKSLNRLVALKMIRSISPGDAVEVQRLRQEAELIAQLDHPHIVPIHEVGIVQEQLYFTMKLTEGGSLAAFREDVRAAAQLLVPVARAVHHAHQRGVLHRDLKPSNIVLDEHGQPLVTDFGLAKRLASDSDLTQTGQLVGTPSYMAPEQAEGKRGTVTTATDVYGLGAILYALLTGKPPFRGETVLETLEQVKGQEPESPRRHNPRVDRDLETVCLKCLDKEPERRYGSAAALADDLQRYLDGEPVAACPPSAGYRFQKFARRHKVALVTSGLVVAALLIGTGVSIWQAVKANYARQQADVNYLKAREAVQHMLTRVAGQQLRTASPVELRRKLLEDAIVFYTQLLELNPRDAPSFAERGQVYRMLGKYELSVADFEKALELQPAQAEYHIFAIWGLLVLDRSEATKHALALRQASLGKEAKM
jgi:serine/threonine-protein kinase